MRSKGAQAVVATSRNGLRALAESPARPAALKLPIFAVGPGTAELARALGFARVTEAAGTVHDLVPIIAGQLQPKAGSVIHLAGETLAFDLAVALKDQRIAARKIVVYRAHPPKTLTIQTTQLMGEGALDAVILMSPRTATIFAQLVAAAGQKDRRSPPYLLVPITGGGAKPSESRARPQRGRRKAKFSRNAQPRRTAGNTNPRCVI